MNKKIKVKLIPYKNLNKNFTQIANSMIEYIPDAYTFKIYFYLCKMHNKNFGYSFPSMRDISKSCNISLKKVQNSIKWLEEQKYIEKTTIKRKDSNFVNNIYKIRYVDEQKIVEAIEQEIFNDEEVIETELEFIIEK